MLRSLSAECAQAARPVSLSSGRLERDRLVEAQAELAARIGGGFAVIVEREGAGAGRALAVGGNVQRGALEGGIRGQAGHSRVEAVADLGAAGEGMGAVVGVQHVAEGDAAGRDVMIAIGERGGDIGLAEIGAAIAPALNRPASPEPRPPSRSKFEWPPPSATPKLASPSRQPAPPAKP